MSNPERNPDEVVCEAADATTVEVMTSREVPLGGPRAMRVRRTLPQRQRSLIGAWCFVDHYGPDDVAETGGMTVAPHPHIGLQTVSWLFTGEVEHRDSAGHHAMVRPGELNLMTGGRGISHSEVSPASTTTLHGVQLWVALPSGRRGVAPDFEHHVPDEVVGRGWRGRVFLGSLLGEESPVTTHTPLVGAEIVLDAGATLDLPVDADFEHGVLVDTGELSVVPVATAGDPDAPPADPVAVPRHALGYVPTGTASVRLTAGEEGARVLVLGGPPFGEAIVMWWNFVGSTHEEVVAARRAWQEQITRDGEVVTDSQDVADGRFGVVLEDHLPPIPAPTLPNVRLKERR